MKSQITEELKKKKDMIEPLENILRMEEVKYFMPTLSTPIIYMTRNIKASYFLLDRSRDVFTVPLISQNILLLSCSKSSLPTGSKNHQARPCLIGFASFHRGYIIPLPLLPPTRSFLWLPNYLTQTWQLVTVLWYWVSLGGGQEEEAWGLAALGSRKALFRCPRQLLPSPRDSVPAVLIPGSCAA